MESKNPCNLAAIYRLDFYKKQKNWKLSTDVSKIKRNKTKAKNQLNKTYDVTKPKTESCQLNDAFLELDPDKSNTVLSSQLHRQNVPVVTKCSYETHTTTSTWQGNVQRNNEPGNNLGTKQRFIENDSQVFLGDNGICIQAERDWQDSNRCSGYNDRWPANDDWGHVPEPGLWHNDLSRNVNGQYYGDDATNMMHTFKDCLQDDMVLPEDENLRWIYENLYSSMGADSWCQDGDQSTDSWGDFMRGAHVAPHSSEIELTVPNNIDVSSLASLSSAQLNAAVESHTKLLCNLLKEEKLRKRNRSRLSLTSGSCRVLFSPRPATVCSDYERPTRDYEPPSYHAPNYTLQRERTFTKTFGDVFVAGSHTNGDLELLGRGRGRLQHATADDVLRAIGVGRGRPVRL